MKGDGKHERGREKGKEMGNRKGDSLNIFRHNLGVENSSTVERFGTEDLEVVVHNLKKFTKYQFIVRAINMFGAGPDSDPVAGITQEDGEYQGRDKFPWTKASQTCPQSFNPILLQCQERPLANLNVSRFLPKV